MKFDFALSLFGLFSVLGVCGFATAFAMACTEEYKTAAVAAAVMAVSVAVACGVGGAIWG